VPTITQHSTGTIYSAFQWFPAPASPTNTSHDKIAIKRSFDGGLTWGTPSLAVFTGSPSGYLRPFDPTLVITDNGLIRMYFSSSRTGTLMSLDSTVHCYSAISNDGINYTWEPGVRVAIKDSINIDPAVIKIGSLWHYTCPRGIPQNGAHHYISNDGLAWTRTTTIASDINHNFTGNLMSELPGGGTGYKFYGTPSPQTGSIWYKTTNDGIGWNPAFTNCIGPITTNGVQADPAVLKISAGNYMMIYVSKKSIVNSIQKQNGTTSNINIFPNPSKDHFTIKNTLLNGNIDVTIYNMKGELIFEQKLSKPYEIHHQLPKGLYRIKIINDQLLINEKILVD
jgi:hypothetical protein